MKTDKFNKFYERYLTGEFICTHRHKDLINVDVIKAAKELCTFEVSYTDLDFKFKNVEEITCQLLELTKYIIELEKTNKYKALIHLAFYFQESDKLYKKIKKELNKEFFEEPGMNFIATTISVRETLDDIEHTKNFFTDFGKVIGKDLKEIQDKKEQKDK